jgi:hypothetical protein
VNGFAVGLGLFIAANLIAVHVRSDGGFLEGLGIVDYWADDIRRIGFPFQFFEEGGFSYRRNVSPIALLADLVVAVVCAAVIGFACSRWHRRRRSDRRSHPARDPTILHNPDNAHGHSRKNVPHEKQNQRHPQNPN